jgi:putative oxidoreductase
MGCTLQRLFSAFPDGSPGAGLLLLRVCVGTALIGSGILSSSQDFSNPVANAQNVVGILCGVFMLAGLWTPLTSTFAALDESSVALTFSPSLRLPIWLHIFFAVLALSVAMLGPGAWSVDARLFGRRRIDIDRKKIAKHPSKG